MLCTARFMRSSEQRFFNLFDKQPFGCRTPASEAFWSLSPLVLMTRICGFMAQRLASGL